MLLSVKKEISSIKNKFFTFAKNKAMTKKSINSLAYKVLGCAIEVHKNIGPGLLESVYHRCLKYELDLKKISYVSERIVPVKYKDLNFDTVLRCDLYVEDCIVVELKSVKEFHPIYDAQILTYMKLLEAPKGLLINFNSYNILEDGQKAFINSFFNNLDD